MARLLVCLPLCLLLSPVYPVPLRNVPEGPSSALATPGPRPALLHAPACSFPASLCWGELYLVGQAAMLPRQAVGLFACPLTEPFPARFPWASLALLGGQGGDHPGRDPVAFLEKCLEHYDRTIHAYSLTMRKRERIDGTLHPLEVIEVHFQDRPHSVFFKWQQGARKAERVLYVEGKHDNKMLAKPAGAAGAFVSVAARAVDSPDARQSGRYPINEFGLKKAMERVLKHWKPAREARTLHVEYLGVHRVPEAGDRPCHKLRRTRYAHPEDDGVTELTLYIDTETLLQVGSVLRGPDGQFLGEYFFSNIRLNPTFRPDQFERAALTSKS